MKFMLMMQGTQSGWETMVSLDAGRDQGAHRVHDEPERGAAPARASSCWPRGSTCPSNAKIVSAKKADAPTVTDGPFAETKEFLAGFWIVDCESPQRAIEIAARASTAPGRGGAPMGIPIEVRQVMSAPPVEG